MGCTGLLFSFVVEIENLTQDVWVFYERGTGLYQDVRIFPWCMGVLRCTGVVLWGTGVFSFCVIHQHPPLVVQTGFTCCNYFFFLKTGIFAILVLKLADEPVIFFKASHYVAQIQTSSLAVRDITILKSNSQSFKVFEKGNRETVIFDMERSYEYTNWILLLKQRQAISIFPHSESVMDL